MVAVLVAALLSVVTNAVVAAPWKMGKPHSPLILRSAGGDETVSIDAHRGTKLVLVHFSPAFPQSVELMALWEKATVEARAEGKLVLIGVMHEQYQDRAALFSQWKKPSVPILHDPLNISQADRLPTVVCLDEEGFVRMLNPKIGNGAESEEFRKFEKDFVTHRFAAGRFEVRTPVIEPPNPRALRRMADESRSLTARRELADALMLGGTPAERDEAMRTYSNVLQTDAKDALAFFRLGVALRMRHDSASSEESDLAQSKKSLGSALSLKPTNVVYRARAVQFANETERPKGMADNAEAWIAEARREISRRGETPAPLSVEPGK